MNEDTFADDISSEAAHFVEALYDSYARGGTEVPTQWARIFDGWEPGGPHMAAAAQHDPVADAAHGVQGNGAPPPRKTSAAQERLDRLVWAFRAFGHLAADVDPLGVRGVGESYWSNLHPTHQLAELTLSFHGLSREDLDTQFSSPFPAGHSKLGLRDIVNRLSELYCGPIGYEFTHVQDLSIRRWFRHHIEQDAAHSTWDVPRRHRALQSLIRADAFEQFIRKKFPGAKVFSIDGLEALVPLLELVLEEGVKHEVQSVVLGMAHRGRLNVLTNVFRKSPADLFRSLEDRLPPGQGHGDVRYHLGDNAQWRSPDGRTVDLSMCFNPSHLEYVNPVAMGRVRAIQDHASDLARRGCMALLIHGDAAFAGEGIVYETLNLGHVTAYGTGGVVHIIANNQIGFTTTPAEGRASTYATDVARAAQIPILHVNGERLDAIARAVELAIAFRTQYGRDIVIDLVGFRRWGHNETDEPSFTQPRLYATIDKHGRLKDRFAEQLVSAGDISRPEVETLEQDAMQYLRDQYDASLGPPGPESQGVNGATNASRFVTGGSEPDDESDTGVELPRLQKLFHKMTEMPEDFHVHPKLRRLLDERRKMAAGEENLDWAAGEALAIATLATEGHQVRFTGQDTERGTFSHRHAVLHDVIDGRTHNIFSLLDPRRQAVVEVLNSPLSEAAAMGFEYGFSLESPYALVAWEAQFGDFVNVAQVIIDQFLASAEDKWQQLSGLVLLLPHGFEGQGPEHSSARMERFLALAAEDNIQIVQPTTPAQYYHLLRRQVKRRWNKPLVVFTPKSLLRLRTARSPITELAEGRFQRVLPDPQVQDPSRILLCSGKVYYEMLAFREQEQRNDVAIVRIEQLYPLAERYLAEALQAYRDETPVIWVQEEPQNMGAWRHWKARFGSQLLGRFPLYAATRPESASPATGSKSVHKHEQETLMQEAFGQPSAPTPLALTSVGLTS